MQKSLWTENYSGSAFELIKIIEGNAAFDHYIFMQSTSTFHTIRENKLSDQVSFFI